MSRFKLPLLLLGVPLLVLIAVDRAVVASDALWRWAAQEVPRVAWAPLRVEGLLRTTQPGPTNLLVLGNSSADYGIDEGALARGLEPRRFRVVNLTVPGTRPLQFAMLARDLAALEASVAVLVTDPAALSERDVVGGVWAYDVPAAYAVFGTRGFLAEPIFHLRGLARQLHVLVRHRKAFQDASLVALGLTSWDERHAQIIRRAPAEEQDPEEVPWMRWFRGEVEVAYPNPGLDAIAYLSRTLGVRGTRVFVVESPANPIIAISYARTRADRFRSELTAHGAAHDYTFMGAPDLGELEVEDFDDMIHLNAAGQARFTEQLAAALAERLPR